MGVRVGGERGSEGGLGLWVFRGPFHLLFGIPSGGGDGKGGGKQKYQK